MTEENKSKKVSGSVSGNLNAPQTIEEMEQTLRIAKCLQGEPVCVINDRQAPHLGRAELREWATNIFNNWGNNVVSPELGEVVVDERSARDTFAHGLSPYKVEAIRSIKDVIEQGVVVAHTSIGDRDHYFISAPINLEGQLDLVTVLVHKDINIQRMYLHSVMIREKILEKDFGQKNTPEHLVPKADSRELSEQNRKLYSGDIGRILQNYLKVNIPELEVEINQQIEQQKGNKMDEQQQQTSEKMDSKNPQQFVQDTIAQYPAPTILHNLDNGFGEPFVRIYFSENPLLHKNQILSIRAADKIFAKLDEMVEREKAADEYRTADKVDFAVISQNRQFNGVGQERYDLGDSNGGLFGLLSENPKYHDLALHMTNYLTADERLGLLDRIDKQMEVDNNYAMAYPEVKEARMAMIANRGVFFERLQQQILQQDKTVEQQQRQPENIMTEAEEHHFFIDRTMAAYPLQSGEPYVLLNRIPNKYGYSEDEYLKMSVSAADIIYRHLNKAAANEVGEISIGAKDGNDNTLFGYKLYIGKFPDEGLWSQFAADKYHHSDLAYLSSFLSTEQRQDLLKELSAEPLYPLNPQAVADRNEFVVRFAEQMQQDKTVEQHLSEMVDEVVAIANRHNQEQSQVESVSGNLKDEVKAIHQELAAQSLEFQFTHKGLADRTAAFNQELLQLAPEQLKELQPFFEQHKAIQTLQGLYEQTNDTARLEEINEHNRLIEWKIHNKVEAYLGKHIDYSDMNYYKNIKTGEELQQMMNEKQPETAVGSSQNNTVQDSSLATQGVNDESISGSPKQSQSQIDEPKNFVQNFVENQTNVQNLQEVATNSNISDAKTFQEKVMFARVGETEISKKIDDIAKQRLYLAVDFEHKDTAKAAGAKWDKVLGGWYAEKGNLNDELQAFLPQQPLTTVENRKPYSDLMAEAQKIGVELNSVNFKEDFHTWVRCPIKGKGKNNRDGGYKLFRNDDGSIGAMVKNYSSGDSVNWCDKTFGDREVKGKVPLPDFIANKKQEEWNEVAKNTVEHDIQQMRSKIAEQAYHSLQPALSTDPYIQNKGIVDIGKLRRLDDGSTIVPLYNNGKIANLQMIRASDNEKRMMTQAVKVGAYYSIGNGKNPQTVIISEGVATADSVHQIATEIYGKDKVLTLAAIDSGNLKAVADKVDKVYPDAQKLIAADNDLGNELKAYQRGVDSAEIHKYNAGFKYANQVIEAYPHFKAIPAPAFDGKNTDWNDILTAKGKETSVKLFQECVDKQPARLHNNVKQQAVTPQTTPQRKNSTDGRER